VTMQPRSLPAAAAEAPVGLDDALGVVLELDAHAVASRAATAKTAPTRRVCLTAYLLLRGACCRLS
jgi:hypothetical protein